MIVAQKKIKQYLFVRNILQKNHSTDLLLELKNYNSNLNSFIQKAPPSV